MCGEESCSKLVLPSSSLSDDDAHFRVCSPRKTPIRRFVVGRDQRNIMPFPCIQPRIWGVVIIVIVIAIYTVLLYTTVVLTTDTMPQQHKLDLLDYFNAFLYTKLCSSSHGMSTSSLLIIIQQLATDTDN
jgi:hypothetical protein